MDTADGAENLGRPGQLNMDYWEEVEEVSCRLLFALGGGLFVCFPERQYFWMASSGIGLTGQKGRAGLCVFVGLQREWDFMAKFSHDSKPFNYLLIK